MWIHQNNNNIGFAAVFLENSEKKEFYVDNTIYLKYNAMNFENKKRAYFWMGNKLI